MQTCGGVDEGVDPCSGKVTNEKTEKSEQPLEQTVQYCATSEGKREVTLTVREDLSCDAVLC